MSHITNFGDLQRVTFGPDQLMYTSRIGLASRLSIARHKIVGQSADDIELLGKESDDIQIDVVLNNAIQPDAYPKRYLAIRRFYEFKSENVLTLPAGDTYYCALTSFAAELTPANRGGTTLKLGFTEKLDPANFNKPEIASLPTVIPTIPTPSLAALSANPNAMSLINAVNGSVAKVKAAISQSFLLAVTPLSVTQSLLSNAFSILSLCDRLAALGIADVNELIESTSQVIEHTQKVSAQNRVKTIGSTVLKADIPASEFVAQKKMSIDDFNALNPLRVGDMTLYKGSEILFYTGATMGVA